MNDGLLHSTTHQGCISSMVNATQVTIRGSDHWGDAFISSLDAAGVDSSHVRFAPAAATSRCMVITSPSGRTMRTAMSPNASLTAKDLIPEEDFGGTKWVFLSAYAAHQPGLLAEAAMGARRAGARVMLDLASWETVKQHSELLKGLMSAGAIDCCVCNEVKCLRPLICILCPE